MTKSDETAKMAEALDRAAQALGKHSGPSSSSGERDAFARDLHTAALRYARAYYAEARDLGLIPEYEATTTIYDHVASSFGVTRDEAKRRLIAAAYGARGDKLDGIGKTTP